MSAFKQLILLGYSGHAFVVADTAMACGYTLAGYMEQEAKSLNPFNIPYCGSEQEATALASIQQQLVFPAIGSNTVRQKLVQVIQQNNLHTCTLVAPSAVVSPYSHIGPATLVAPRAVVNPLARIGQGCIINTGAIIEHECTIGDYSHIAPGAVLAGNVTVGNNSFIGANAVVKQGVTIGQHVTIGAGAVVLNNIPDNETWVGNPARKLK